jgi:alpha/beta superfamily hydrolase
VPTVHGGLPLSQRHRLANAIGGAVVALSPPTDRPVMDRSWRLGNDHVADMQSAVHWTKSQWPQSRTWVLGLNNGALSAAVATASIDDLAGAVLLSCVDEALDQPQKSDRMRVLAVRHRADSGLPHATHLHAGSRKTLVTVHDERQSRSDVAQSGNVVNAPQFNGKEHQVVDVVARWILTGAAPDEIR